MSEPLDLLPEAIPIECLDGVDDPGVKLTAAVRQELSVCDLVGERMPERILGLAR